MDIQYFVRRKNKGYFSIEQLFKALANYIGQCPKTAVMMTEMPYFFSPLNFFRNILFVRKNQQPINHITGDIHYAIFGCSKKNLNILTIHDCVMLERYGKWDIRYWIFRWLWYDLPMRKADLITVISEKTKKDLLEKLGYGAHKIRVVSNFVNDAFCYRPAVFNKVKPALLFIGSTPNKNLDRILQAITGLSCRLLIVGRLSDAQKQYIKDHNIDTENFFELSMEELAALYAASDMVLFPSLYEGFGMLIVEANASGRPVLTSNISPMTEVAGTAAAFVDPRSTDAIRSGIEKIIHDDAFRESIVQEGFKNAGRYSLAAVAAQYMHLYREFGSQKIAASPYVVL